MKNQEQVIDVRQMDMTAIGVDGEEKYCNNSLVFSSLLSNNIALTSLFQNISVQSDLEPQSAVQKSKSSSEEMQL